MSRGRGRATATGAEAGRVDPPHRRHRIGVGGGPGMGPFGTAGSYGMRTAGCQDDEAESTAPSGAEGVPRLPAGREDRRRFSALGLKGP